MPNLASGEWIGGFALTEPQAGSDTSNLKTRARRECDHYIIEGAKQFITSVKNGHVTIVIAVTDPGAAKIGIRAFIVPTDTPGYEVLRVEEKLGLNASDTCQIAFNGMKIPAENRLGEEGEGYRIALSNLEGGRIGIAAQSVCMRRRLSRRHATMPASERLSANRLPSIRQSPFVRRHRSRPSGNLSGTQLPCVRQASPASPRLQ